MSHEDFKNAHEELDALRESLPATLDGTVPAKTERIYYSLDVAKFIVNDYAQGISLYKISQKAGMPGYSTILKWAKDHPELSKMLRAVREARALHFEDAAIDAAEAATGKDADRLKVDTYQWAASVNDPATYGKKVTHAGDASNPVILQVVTGFGPPNAWQTPPKLKADGTIDRESESVATHEPEQPTRLDSPGGDAENNRAGEATQPAGLVDAEGLGGRGDVDGVQALPAVEGHTADRGSPPGAFIRGEELRGGLAEDPTHVDAATGSGGRDAQAGHSSDG